MYILHVRTDGKHDVGTPRIASLFLLAKIQYLPASLLVAIISGSSIRQSSPISSITVETCLVCCPLRDLTASDPFSFFLSGTPSPLFYFGVLFWVRDYIISVSKGEMRNVLPPPPPKKKVRFSHFVLR